MAPVKNNRRGNGQSPLLDTIRREREEREKTYRARALNIFPPVCAHCGREFSGKRLVELTVHHKDHNHDNNPNDGSNWELLCIYCHEYEHTDHEPAGQDGPSPPVSSSTFKPFQSLEKALKPKKSEHP